MYSILDILDRMHTILFMSDTPIIRHELPLPQQLQAIRVARGRSILELAEKTGLSRLTASAAEGKTDARLSTIVTLFDALGYTLIPVPKPMATEVAAFINNGGRSLVLPAGTNAPLGVGQQSFLQGQDADEQEPK